MPCFATDQTFHHNGDTIYADGQILAEQKMPNGEI
jgi:hypothetical protein